MKAIRSARIEKIKKFKNRIGLCFLCSMILSAAGCQSFHLASAWKNSEIKIDGKSDDWVGRMMFLDSPNVSLGIQNDENFIYICLIAEDPSIRNRINMRGMTLWFDPDGRKQKTLGINFPMGREDLKVELRDRMAMDQERDPARMRQRFLPNLIELEILRSGPKEPLRISLDNLKGIEVSLNSASGLLIYEAKVPLEDGQNFPFSIGAQKGSLIGVGLEVPKMELSPRPGGMGGQGGQSGGMGGRGGTGGGIGGRGGMGGGMSGRSRMGGQLTNMQQAIKIWATVQLASATVSKQN